MNNVTLKMRIAIIDIFKRYMFKNIISTGRLLYK